MSTNGRVFTPKEAFVARELERHGRYLTELFAKDIKRRRLKDSETLLDFIEANPFSVDAHSQRLSMEFPDYGRFIEIRYNKKKRAYKVLGTEARREIWGMRGIGKKRGKFARWYAHNLYGSINTLIGRVSWGYTEEVAGELKGALEDGSLGVS